MAAQTTSCFSFLKEALTLPRRNPKLFTLVLLLLNVTSFLATSVHVLFLRPFADGMVSHLIDIKNTDLSSYEYAYYLEAIKQDAAIVIPELVIVLALGFVFQLLAFFAASRTYSGDRYTLAKLVREISKGSTLQGPSITIAVVITFSLAWMAALGVLLFVTIRGRPFLSVQGLIFLLALLAFFYFTVLAVVSVAASVADEGYHGVRVLRQAWRLMTRVRRKEGLVLVLVAYLLQTVVNLVYGFALVYANNSMAVCLGMLAVYAFLSGAHQLFYIVAATVYYYEAMESKEAAPGGCAKTPGEGII